MRREEIEQRRRVAVSVLAGVVCVLLVLVGAPSDADAKKRRRSAPAWMGLTLTFGGASGGANLVDPDALVPSDGRPAASAAIVDTIIGGHLVSRTTRRGVAARFAWATGVGVTTRPGSGAESVFLHYSVRPGFEIRHVIDGTLLSVQLETAFGWAGPDYSSRLQVWAPGYPGPFGGFCGGLALFPGGGDKRVRPLVQFVDQCFFFTAGNPHFTIGFGVGFEGWLRAGRPR